jgi:anaerobic glycerol-3-phosphate dehydrogenase
MNMIDHLAHELIYIDAQLERCTAVNAWIEVDTLEMLREQIRETRSILIRQAIRYERLHAQSVA